MPITITEEFDSPIGQAQNYDMYNTAHRDALLANRHVNIRSFIQTDIALTLDMQSLELNSMQTFDTLTMNDIESDIPYFAGEKWTGGTCAPDSTNHNVNTLTILCTANVEQIAASVTLDSANSKLTTQRAETNVKALMDVDPNAVIALTIPQLWTFSLTNASCFLELTSEATGAFTDYTVSIPFSTGNFQSDSVNWPLTALTATKVGTHYLDPSAITGVRIRLLSTVNATITVTGLRALGSNWNAPYAGDWDTRYQRFARVVDLNGALSNSSESVFRAAYPPGQDYDPHPIDVKLTCAFHSGTVGADINTMTFYFRERAEDYENQVTLNTYSQANLEAIKAQPDYGQSIFTTRHQSDLEVFGQSNLDTQTQAELEEEQDLLSAAWIEAKIVWNNTGTTLTIKDTATAAGDEYVLTSAALTASQDYLLTLDLETNTLTLKLQKLDQHGTLTGNPVWSESIIDDSMFRRRKGRVGWNLNLLDGQAYVDGIRTAKTMFAEYQSLPFQSITPADGIELFVSGMPDRELVQGIDPGPYGGTVVPDVTHTNSTDGAFKVTTSGTPLQGVMTTPVLIEDFESTSCSFDIYYPQSTIDQGGALQVILLGDRGRILELPLPQLQGDRWQTIRLSSISNNDQQTGNYRLVVWQTQAISSSWWIDNISIKARSMAWSGRVDPRTDWLDFRDTYNSDSSGVRFLEPGFETQVRGQALRQDAYLGKVAFKPRYAELGRLVWPEDKPAATTVTAVASSSLSGLTGTFHGDSSTTTGGFLVDWLWYFGDGSFEHGPTVSHTYALSGTYTVTLVVTDNRGNRDSATLTVTV